MRKKINNMKKNNKLYTIILTILLSIASLSFVFYGAYYYMFKKSTSSYDKMIIDIIININENNKKTNQFIKNSTLDSDLIKTELPNIIDNLNTIKNSLLESNPPSVHRESQDYLERGVQNNILFFGQVLSIVNHPESDDIEVSLAQLKIFSDDMKSFYSQCMNKTSHILLPDEVLSFSNISYKYGEELVSIKNSKEVNIGQNLYFSDRLDTVVKMFDNIKSSFNNELENARNNSTSFDVVLIAIDNKKDSYNDVKKEFLSINTPNDGISLRNEFSEILDEYGLYLQELRFAVSNEMAETKNKSIKTSNLENIYSTANLKYKNLLSKYESFLKNFSNFKITHIK